MKRRMGEIFRRSQNTLYAHCLHLRPKKTDVRDRSILLVTPVSCMGLPSSLIWLSLTVDNECFCPFPPVAGDETRQVRTHTEWLQFRDGDWVMLVLPPQDCLLPLPGRQNIFTKLTFYFSVDGVCIWLISSKYYTTICVIISQLTSFIIRIGYQISNEWGPYQNIYNLRHDIISPTLYVTNDSQWTREI